MFYHLNTINKMDTSTDGSMFILTQITFFGEGGAGMGGGGGGNIGQVYMSVTTR